MVQSIATLRTVLLIEGDPAYSLMIRDLLAAAGNGRWRLERADRLTMGLGHLTDASFDIVLADLSLPRERAASVLHEVRLRADGSRRRARREGRRHAASDFPPRC